MSDTEYTPTTNEVREDYSAGPETALAFDRWLAVHDAQVRAEATVEFDARIEAAHIVAEEAFQNGDDGEPNAAYRIMEALGVEFH